MKNLQAQIKALADQMAQMATHITTQITTQMTQLTQLVFKPMIELTILPIGLIS